VKFIGGQIARRPLLVPLGLGVGGAAAVSPTVRQGIDIATDPSTFITGGKIAGDVIEGKPPDISLGEAVAIGGLVGAGALIIPKVFDFFKNGDDDPDVPDTILETQQIEPTLAPDIPATPTPLGAEGIVLDEKEDEKDEVNIDIDVKPEINVKPSKNEVFINNIVQSI